MLYDLHHRIAFVIAGLENGYLRIVGREGYQSTVRVSNVRDTRSPAQQPSPGRSSPRHGRLGPGQAASCLLLSIITGRQAVTFSVRFSRSAFKIRHDSSTGCNLHRSVFAALLFGPSPVHRSLLGGIARAGS